VLSLADVTWYTQSDGGALTETSSSNSLSSSTASVSDVCSQLPASDDDDDDDDEQDAETHGDAVLVTSSMAVGVLRHCVDEHGVTEPLGVPISNFGVCQQQDDVQSGVPCNEHMTDSGCNDRTLTTDCVMLRGNMASRSSFLNTYSGCFTPTHVTAQQLSKSFLK